MTSSLMLKKRKAAGTLEEDRSLYAAFSGAANSISHLYTQTVQHQRRHYAAGGRDFAERLLTWAREREAAGEAHISTSQLIACLEREAAALAADEDCASTVVPPASPSAGPCSGLFAGAARAHAAGGRVPGQARASVRAAGAISAHMAVC